MATDISRTDPSDDKSDVSPSGPGLKPMGKSGAAPVRTVAPGQEPGWGAPRNTPPDNPFDEVKTHSNE